MKQALKPDLSPPIIAYLALLAIPRVVIHDLRILPLDGLVYQFLAVTPFGIWLIIALWRKSPRPVADFISLGLCFGFFLGLTHQILWDASWGNNPPTIGGNLENILPPFVENIFLRIAALISSLVTGLIVGLALGLVAKTAQKIKSRS